MQDIIIPQAGSIIWTVAVFVVLLFVLRRWAWKPILDALNAREEGIRNNILAAQNSRQEADRLLQEYRAQLDQARKEAQKLIGDASARAEILHQQRKQEIEDEAHAMIEKARADIDRERQKVVQELRQQVVDIALDAAAKVIDRSLQAEDHSDLINREIEKLN
ncbi:MAG: ATP synthase F0 subunit B [Candidatus Zixiibacteriota bacterium]|nr:MAG: ATP synthase F0 subunit B [candidate division Zixibacteria bacterium]